ncbi:hypothetical protein ACFVZH_14360 [Streptomyces sp. NPDC059534]|uniref:hypothetical protein n=1 Tax=Streptomyces sp. NPDC059534 TaxID=3346859 RepID=UPI003683CBE2
MRGPAAPTSPGAWDARSEALLGTPALTPSGALDPRAVPADATGLDLRAPEAPADPFDAADPAEASAPFDATDRTAPFDAADAADPTDPADAAGPAESVDPFERVDASAPAGIAPAPEAAPTALPEPGSGRSADRPEAPVAGAAWRRGPEAAARPDARAAAPAAPRPRRGNADPVKVLMHRHRELCERAVDPLEIAAGLEAQGFTDRTAARFRHRDVFSLAEELYARVPRGYSRTAPPAEPEPPRAPWALAVLAPGAVAGLAGLALTFTYGSLRVAVGAAAVPALGGALLLAVRQGPFRVPGGGTVPAARLWTFWLLAYAVAGDGLLTQVLSGGPDGVWDLTPAPLLGLALAVAPAAWCAHHFARRARRRIADSRGLADFAAATRPLLLGTVALQLLALTALLALTGFSPGALALGALLLLARLLTVHGFPETAAAALAAASAAEALALASVLAARVPLPGFDGIAAPVRAVVDAWGTGAVPTLVCGAAALGLLAHATGALARASAHATP